MCVSSVDCGIPWNWNYRCCESTDIRSRNQTSGPLEEQQARLTVEPPLYRMPHFDTQFVSPQACEGSQSLTAIAFSMQPQWLTVDFLLSSIFK